MKFSQTCTLLSQYLKQNKGSLPDLNLGFETTGMATNKTMDLFPQQSGSVMKEQLPCNSDSSEHKSEPEASSQMTIFYNGKVIIFNDFPADKAKELVLLASKNSDVPNPSCYIPAQAQKPIEPKRKASLAQFLEKRKDRIIGRAPYAKPGGVESRHGLAAKGPARLECQL